jgi:hypothetical protein
MSRSTENISKDLAERLAEADERLQESVKKIAKSDANSHASEPIRYSLSTAETGNRTTYLCTPVT